MPASKPVVALLFVIAGAITATAQITDNFSDGNFNADPQWSGDSAHFTVNGDGQLQLLAPAAGASMLAVEGNIPDSAVWRMDVRLDFAPSTSNLLRIYLLADQPDLSAASGYLLEIGETGNADALRLLRQDAGVRTLLATGNPGAVAVEPVDIRLLVRRRADGLWSVDMAPDGGSFTPQMNAVDTVYGGGSGRWFGLFCQYSATRTDKFFFDNLDIRPDLPDTQPPVLLGAEAVDSAAVRAVFNESLDPATAFDTGRYSLSGGVGAPSAVEWSADGQSVLLRLGMPLQTGDYTLECTGLSDVAGNTAGTQTAAFNFILMEAAVPGDVIINEIMADPSPSAGLPEVEWLELYNRSGRIIDLQTLRLSDGGAAQVLPAVLLYPDSFVVLCSMGSAALMATSAGSVQGMAGFPGLNNSGETLVLSRLDGLEIDRTEFQSAWHTEAGKEDGGWSLERINPVLPCGGAENWRSCPVLPGGTPARRNAAYSLFPPTEAPRITSAYPTGPFAIRVEFSRNMDPFFVLVPDAYRIEVAVGDVEPIAGDVVVLHLESALQPGELYRLTLSGMLVDCYGLAVPETDTILLALPEAPEPDDIVINEILFNPASGGSRFVELYNRSDKVFDRSALYLANFNSGATLRPVGAGGLFLPGMYAVCTTDPMDILMRFPDARPDWLFPVDLPSLPDDAGNLTLIWATNGQSSIIDSLWYSDTYHNAFFTGSDREGVSLERIRADAPGNDPANWTSAAGPPGGPAGTPTRPNGQRMGQSGGDSGWLQLSSTRFSPDDDGYEDFLMMTYALPGPGFSAMVVIYDAGGVPVKHLRYGFLAATEGLVRWDGDANDGTRLRPGIYVVYAEFISPDGAVLRAKRPVALIGF